MKKNQRMAVLSKGLVALFFIALAALLGCPTGSSTDPSPDSGPESGGSDESGGGSGLPTVPGGIPDTDSPGSGYLSTATADKIFIYTPEPLTITGVRSVAALSAYLDGVQAPIVPAVQAAEGPLFAITSGGSRTLKLAAIGGKPVVGIATGAFKPVTGTAYDSEKDITRIVGKLELPRTITSLGTNLFEGVKATIKVEIPPAVVDAVLADAKANAGSSASTITEETLLIGIVGQEAVDSGAVTVTRGTSTPTDITGAPALVSVGTPSLSSGTLTVTFTFSQAVTVASASVSVSAGTVTSFSGTAATAHTISVSNVPGTSGALTFTFTATATAGGKETIVTETVTYGTTAAPTESEVAKSTSPNTTTEGLVIASKTKTGNVHRITLTGTAEPKVPSALLGAAGYGENANGDDVDGFAVFTFTGIKSASEAAWIQQSNQALELTIINVDDNPYDDDSAPTNIDYNDVSDNTVYYWKTGNPAIYNRLRYYGANPSDADFSVVLAPGSTVGEQIVTLTKTVPAAAGQTDPVTTTYIIDYTAVRFDVSETVAVSTEGTGAHTTPNLAVASAIQEGSDVYITLSGTNVPLTIADPFKTAMFLGVTNVAVITLDGIWASGETALIHQANPGLAQYVTGSLDVTATSYTTTPKNLTDVEAAFTSNVGRYFWQTPAPVTYNKLSRGTGDGVTSILLAKTTNPAEQKATLTKKTGGTDLGGPLPGNYTKAITYHLDYTNVTFVTIP